MVRVDETQRETVQQLPVPETLERLSKAQRVWALAPLLDRLGMIKRFRHLIAEEAEQLASLVELPQRSGIVETLAAEVMPLADACRYLERNATKLLSPKHASASDRPAWGRGLRVQTHRDPLGKVMVIGTWNYPIFLTCVQTIQAIVAGNAVLLKPGDGTTAVTKQFVEMLFRSGVSRHLIEVLPEDPQLAQEAIDVGGVDKVVFTGSVATGRKVLAQLAKTNTPSVMELSGNDAVFVLPDADLERAARCVAFGLRMNGSSTCIAPRRVFVPHHQIENFKAQLLKHVDASYHPVHPKAGELAARLVSSAKESGANLLCPTQWNGWNSDEGFPQTVLQFESADHELLQSDLFAPVTSLISVRDAEEALSLDALCPYALGATVFGPTSEATQFATRVKAGCVTINDMIAPTADPRVAFGGRGASGFGVTRGAEGLLEMTQVKTIVTQTSGWLPHLDRPVPELADLLLGMIRMNHSETWSKKLDAVRGLMDSGRAYWNATKKNRERD